MNSLLKVIQLRKDDMRKMLLRNVSTRSFSLTSDTEKFYDVAIVGGGVVGSSLANLLNRKIPSLRVALIEATDPPQQPPEQRVPHPRSYALSPQSLDILGDAVTSKLPLGYYDSMQVWQSDSPATLTFNSNDVDGDPGKSPYLGACCEDQPLVATLWEDIQWSTHCMANTKLQSITTGDTNTLATITTQDGAEIQAALVIGADGGQSWVRKSTGISRFGGDYEQHAMTFTVSLADDDSTGMNRRAYQRYLADGGPMALLPTYSPSHAVVVWSSSPETLSKWKSEHDDDLVRLLNESLSEGPMRIPPLMEGKSSQGVGSVLSNLIYGAERVLDTVHYGLAMASQHPNPSFRTPPRIAAVASPKFTFPLSCFQASTYVKGRVALVGDAAHTVHPMAGQGLNLGLGDVDALAKCLEKAHKAGMDLSSFLNEYNSHRQRSVSVSLGGIHLLQRLFLLQNVPMLHMKTLGLNLVQNVGPLRRQLAVAAAHGLAL